MDGLPPYLIKPPAYVKEGSIYVRPKRAIYLPSNKRATFPLPFMMPASVTLSLSVTDTSRTSTTTNSVQSISSVQFGAQDSNRQIIVVVHASDATTSITVSSATIAGSSATIIHQATSTTFSRIAAIIGLSDSSATTSGTVAVTFSDSVDRMGLTCYRMIRPSGLTANDTVSDNDNSNPVTGSIDVNAGGIVIGVAGGFFGSSGPGNLTWSGLTEDDETTVQNANNVHGAASLLSGTTQTVAVSCESANGFTSSSLVAAAFNP